MNQISSLNTVFGDLRYRNDDTELFLNFGQANTDLRGNGAAPLSLWILKVEMQFILILIQHS